MRHQRDPVVVAEVGLPVELDVDILDVLDIVGLLILVTSGGVTRQPDRRFLRLAWSRGPRRRRNVRVIPRLGCVGIRRPSSGGGRPDLVQIIVTLDATPGDVVAADVTAGKGLRAAVERRHDRALDARSSSVLLEDGRQGRLFLPVVANRRGAQTLVVELDAQVAEPQSVVDAVLGLDPLCRYVAGLNTMQQDGEREAEAFGNLLHKEVGLVACDVFAQLDNTAGRIGGTIKE